MKNSTALTVIGVMTAALFVSQAAISSDRGNTPHNLGTIVVSFDEDLGNQPRPKCTKCHDKEPTDDSN